MIDAETLKHLLTDMESDRVERTSSFTKEDKMSEAICAFANDLPNNKLPGYLIVGVHDNGALAGISVSDQLLKDLAGIRANGNIQPLPQMTVKKFSFEGGDVAVAEVFPSSFPPVRFRGRVCVRVGPRKAYASEQEERTLIERRIASARTFDSSPAQEASLDDLSLALFATYRQQVIAADIIEANHRNIENQLASLRFYDTKKHCPTHAGVLLFGKNPRYYLPGAYIQFLKINGHFLTDEISNQAEISGDLLSVLRELDTLSHVNITTVLEKQTLLTEKAHPDYPERALRELLMNAVMHRDYQSNAPIKFYWFNDRIEIHSPGGPYGIVTLDTMETTSDYRNPVIAEMMQALGYVNRYGYGIQQAQASLKANGNPPAEFTGNGNFVLAVIKKRPE
jgi:ATP-dependent DNA helicase RecG